MTEEETIKFEVERNAAMDKYVDARPQLNITREKECFFEAGFRMAWDFLKADKGCHLYIDYTKDCQALKDNELSRQGIDPRSVK